VRARAVASVQPLQQKADWLIFKRLLFVFSSGPVCARELTIKEPGLFWRGERTPGKLCGGGGRVVGEGNVALVFYISTEWLPSNKDALHSVAVWNKPLVSCLEEALAQTMRPGREECCHVCRIWHSWILCLRWLWHPNDQTHNCLNGTNKMSPNNGWWLLNWSSRIGGHSGMMELLTWHINLYYVME